MNTHLDSSTICALSTPAGSGALAIVRVSGPEAITLCDRLFIPRSGAPLAERRSHTATFGRLVRDGELLDEAVATVFRAPHSFTGEDTVELSCHGSTFIQQRLLEWLIDCGARAAAPGEFTRRAFLNGRMDLSQAEAVADLIASTSAGMHRVAMNQMRGGFSDELATLRTQLLEFASLVELELDFGDHEELEFADRTRLGELADLIARRIDTLAASFAAGNALKHGLPVAIIGRPNVGKSTLVKRVLGRREAKSTLLNGLLNEERAIVSDIPGTTRDTIEETLTLDGRLFRFIDTAGLRDRTTDRIEEIGIRRSFEKADQAAIILYLLDLTDSTADDWLEASRWLRRYEKPVLMVGTKNDLARRSPIHTTDNVQAIHISCREPADIERVKLRIVELADTLTVGTHDVIVTNVRHYEALCRAGEAIRRVLAGLRAICSRRICATASTHSARSPVARSSPTKCSPTSSPSSASGNRGGEKRKVPPAGETGKPISACRQDFALRMVSC